MLFGHNRRIQKIEKGCAACYSSICKLCNKAKKHVGLNMLLQNYFFCLGRSVDF